MLPVCFLWGIVSGKQFPPGKNYAHDSPKLKITPPKRENSPRFKKIPPLTGARGPLHGLKE
uniref:Uncharacterized protein n=1 Tax=Ochlerotatus taeniorhynchus TaxID=329105 RepID=B8XY15_OCHTA|nr:hypothetical protein [Ochlerotatus taeniorhynchus]